MQAKQGPWMSRITRIPSNARRPVLVVVDGANDIEFLKRIASVMRQNDSSIADLADLEKSGHIVFIPRGGSDHRLWSERFWPLELPELHLFDRDVEPYTETRYSMALEVSERHQCLGVVTRKRSLENYLHPSAIKDAMELSVTYGDEDDVALVTARAKLIARYGEDSFADESRRYRKRLVYTIKRRLNTDAVDRMTKELLVAQDPEGEVYSWLAMIARMVNAMATE